MNISRAATRSGLPTKTIRYYEEIGLVAPKRSSNGYRSYTDEDIHRLRFLQRARRLGFTIDECRSLLSLYDDEARHSADVKAIALNKIDEIDRKMDELRSLRETLNKLACRCHGDERPQCPIIEDLAR